MAENTNPAANNETNNNGTDNQQAQQNQQATPNFDELFSKLDGAMEKRFDGLAKSMLKGNGVADDDLGNITEAYKQYRTDKANQTTQALAQAQADNNTLKAQLLNMQIQNVARDQATSLGIDATSVGYVVKLADLSKCVDEKGMPDAAKIAEAMKKVVDDVPAFKKSATENTGFVKVGGNGGTQETISEKDARLRKAFGLK